MPISSLLDQAKQHPYLIALSLFACLVVSGVAATAYMQVSEARLGVREERIGLMDERLKMQEVASARQKHTNKMVQEQIAALRRGFDGLQPAVSNVRTLLTEAEKSGNVKSSFRERLHSNLQTVEQHIVVLQAAISTSEALSRTMEVSVNGVVAEELKQYAKAADFYRQAANAGVPDATSRLAALYLSGRGVEKNENLAERLFERSALLGDLQAKDQLVKMYVTGHGSEINPVRAAAILAIEPRSGPQLATLESLSQGFNEQDQQKLQQAIEDLRKTQAKIVERAPGSELQLN